MAVDEFGGEGERDGVRPVLQYRLSPSGGGVDRLLFLEVLELVHHDVALGEVGDDPQFSPQGRHETTQR